MKTHRIAAAIAAIVLPMLAANAQAAELRVYASTATKAALEQLGPQFETATGNKLVFTFGPAAKMKKEIEQGAAFDVAILTPALTDALAASGKIDPAGRATVARAGSGIAVRAGAPLPDVSTVAALRQTLLNAKSIGYVGIGASRAGNEAMLKKLGILDAVKPKIKLLKESAPVEVAKGVVEIGLGPMSEVPLVSGAALAGSYPAEFQSYLVFTAGVSSASKHAAEAEALIRFLKAPAAAPVFKANYMEPG